MLCSVVTPAGPRLQLGRGLTILKNEQAVIPAAAGWALFEVPSHLLRGTGQVEVEIVAPLDGRAYLVRRALEVPDHWQVQDLETGWLAAAGPADVPHWLRHNLDVAQEWPPRELFREVGTFSLPVTLGWLLEEQGLRERKCAQLLRTEQYRSGLRWLDTAAAGGLAQEHEVARLVAALEGQDRPFEGIRQAYEAAREASLSATETVAKLRLELAAAEAGQERLNGVEAELAELRAEMHARRLAISALDVQAERWRHWQAVHDRATQAMREHEAGWRGYQETLAEIARCASQLSGVDQLRLELRTAMANALALQREQTLLERHVSAIRAAETAAADLAEPLHQQQQIEQQIALGQERAIRLELVNRALQQTLQETKRVEVLLAEVDRQQAEIEQLAPQAARVKKLQAELDEQQRLAREAGKQVDHLRFVEAAARATSGHLDELRKGSTITERLAVKAGVGATPAAAPEERTVASHLREAIDHQVEALERQLRDWQVQTRDLAGAPMRQNQLRATIHQLEQELAAARQVELKLGGVPALKQHRKYLAERLDQLRKLTEAQLKEQRECGDAARRLGGLRHDLLALKDPRAEREALLRTAAGKDAAEVELKQVQRSRAEAELRQQALEARLAAMAGVQAERAELEHRRDDLHEAYCTYLAQQAIAELASDAETELDAVAASLAAQRRLQEEAEARETALSTSRAALAQAPQGVAALAAGIEQAERRAADWNDRYQAAAQEHAAAEETRGQLRERRAQLETHARADRLLAGAHAAVARAEVALGQQVRDSVAEAAAPYLACLLDDPGASLSWRWGEAPVLLRGGASHPLDELSPFVQASCALVLRLALATRASRFGTVFVSGLGPLLQSDELVSRLQALPDLDQLLVVSTW